MEGLAREVVRRIQELRKQSELNVDDHILVEYQASDRLANAIDAHREYIAAETLSDQFRQSMNPNGEAISEHIFDEEKMVIALTKPGEG